MGNRQLQSCCIDSNQLTSDVVLNDPSLTPTFGAPLCIDVLNNAMERGIHVKQSNKKEQEKEAVAEPSRPKRRINLQQRTDGTAVVDEQQRLSAIGIMGFSAKRWVDKEGRPQVLSKLGTNAELR